MNQFVDIHCHVLPGVDDGARSIDESIAMLRLAVSDGISRIVATPHSHRCTPEQMLDSVERLRQLVEELSLTVEILPGMEVRFDADIADRCRAGSALMLNRSHYLLLELSLHGDWSPFLPQVVYELGVSGVTPVLAHAERYPSVQREPSVLADLIRAGALVQVNGDSILGRGGESARRTSEALLHSRMVHVLASDAHSSRSRPPLLSTAYERMVRLVGDADATRVVSGAQAIIDDQVVEVPDPESADPIQQRRWSFRKWFG